MDWSSHYGSQHVSNWSLITLAVAVFIRYYVINRDTVGTFEIAKVFGEFKMLTCKNYFKLLID